MTLPFQPFEYVNLYFFNLKFIPVLRILKRSLKLKNLKYFLDFKSRETSE